MIVATDCGRAVVHSVALNVAQSSGSVGGVFVVEVGVSALVLLVLWESMLTLVVVLLVEPRSSSRLPLVWDR